MAKKSKYLYPSVSAFHADVRKMQLVEELGEKLYEVWSETATLKKNKDDELLRQASDVIDNRISAFHYKINTAFKNKTLIQPN